MTTKFQTETGQVPEVESSIRNWQRMHEEKYFQIHRCYQDRLYDDGVAMLRNLLDFQDTDDVLEIGCGYGRLMYHLAPTVSRITGIDLADEPLHEAAELLAEYDNVGLIHGSGCSLSDVANYSIDKAYAFTVFQHIPDDLVKIYLDEVNRVLCPGGYFCAQFLTGSGLPAKIEDEAREQSFCRNAAEICEYAENAGLEVYMLQREVLPRFINLDWYWLLARKIGKQ